MASFDFLIVIVFVFYCFNLPDLVVSLIEKIETSQCVMSVLSTLGSGTLGDIEHKGEENMASCETRHTRCLMWNDWILRVVG